jgi:hypothetical protein
MIVSALDWAPVDVPEAELFNVNTPLELVEAEARFRLRPL